MELFLRLVLRIMMIGSVIFLIIVFLPLILLILLILAVTGNIAMIRTASVFDRFRSARDDDEAEDGSPASVSDGDAIDAEVIHAETIDPEKK